MDLELPSLDFISNEILKKNIERDILELNISYKTKLLKSTLVMAGSIVESILLDYLLDKKDEINYKEEEIQKFVLAKMIEVAESKNIISKTTKELAIVIKDYRNLIHPAREIRLKETIDVNYAQVAHSLLQIIINDINRNFNEKNSYSAETVISKIIKDPESTIVFSSLISRMRNSEREQLFKTIPSLCYEKNKSYFPSLESFKILYSKLKESVGDNAKKNEIKKFLDIIHSSSRHEILFLSGFYIEIINFLSDEERKQIIDYLFSNITNVNLSELNLYKKINFSYISHDLKTDKNDKLLIDAIIARQEDLFIDTDLDFDSINFEDKFLKIIYDIIAVENSFVERVIKTLKSKSYYPKVKLWGEQLHKMWMEDSVF